MVAQTQKHIIMELMSKEEVINGLQCASEIVQAEIKNVNKLKDSRVLSSDDAKRLNSIYHQRVEVFQNRIQRMLETNDNA